MTRFLSESLEAKEPFFRLGIKRLEAANGNPSTDIRFTSEVLSAAHSKLPQLGLDPKDTTPKELYEALKQRVKLDDERLTKRLRTLAATYVSAEAEPTAGMIQAIKHEPDSKRCFAMKTSKLKSLLKSEPPKKAMRALGYRSLQSMLKHEPPVLIMAAAYLSESSSWQKRLLDQYKKLIPSDFEERRIMLLQPTSKRWRELSRGVVSDQKHNLVSFKELGAIIFLPLSGEEPAGTITACLSLALHELNEIRACSSFLKFKQVRPDFGSVVARLGTSEPMLSSPVLDQSLPWSLIQHYYARLSEYFREDIFEPYVRLEDMVWHPIEQTLASIEPSFAFWQDSAYLGLMGEGRAVSLNLVDSALNLCNKLPFDERVVHYFQRSLWHELLMRYLRHEPLEHAVMSELQPELAEARVMA